MKNRLLWLAIMLCLTSIRSSATIVYVDSANFAGNQDGTTWSSAYYSFQYGIDFSNPGDTIWVAKGTYLPVAGTFFALKKDVKIFGGFKNTDTVFNQRNLTTNLTRLKGNGATIIKNDSALLITNSTILDGFTISNSSPGCGMANTYASPTITNCIFSNNVVSGLSSGGGAMSNYGSNPYIGNCTFSNNGAPIFYGNPPNASGSGGGGAMINRGSSPTIYRCTFSGNTSTTGGAIYNAYNSHPVISYSTFSNNTLSSVSITTKGGAIYNALGATVNLDSCRFSANQGTRGGAICNDSVPSSIITRCVFINNNASDGAGVYNRSVAINTMDSCYFGSNTTYNSGAGVYGENGPLLLTNSRFATNNNGSCIITTNNAPVTVTGCTFSGNKTGGIGVSNTLALMSTISNCRFEYDSANGIGMSNAPVNVNNCVFFRTKGGINISTSSSTIATSNVTNCSFTNNNNNVYYGGAISISSCSPVISNCTFNANSASGNATYARGGAMYITGTSSRNAMPTITQCNFTGNSAQRGGAIYCDDYGMPNLTDCIFTNNSASLQGGAVWGNVTKVKKCNFTGNTTPGYGGALYGVSYPVEHTLFVSNTARIGGGIYSSNSLTSVVNCIFTKNVADSFGGGMYNSAPPAFVTNATFFGNRANVQGSPIYNTNYGNYNDSTFTNCVIWGNYSGIFNQNTGASAFSYSLVQGLGTFAVKHILGGTINPQFVDTAAGNFQLLPNSPCIDQGYNSYVPAGITTDIGNGPRIQGGTVDFGAFEFGNVALGMDLLHFSGKMQNNNTVLLEWQMNNDKVLHTTLQRSGDGRSFTPVYNTRTNPGLNNLAYVDEQPLAVNYYRLEISNEQGSLSYSNTISVRMDKSAGSSVIYPNPAKESIHLVTRAAALLNSTAVITDLAGKILRRANITATDQQISLTGLPQGMYLVRLADGTTLKFSKQ